MSLLLHLIRLFVRGTALLLALAALLLGLAGLGGAFSDRLDAVTHFAPLTLAAGLAGALLAAIVSRRSERWAILAMALMATAANAALLAPELIAARAPVDAGPADIKIVQFNAWASNEGPRKSLDWLLAEDPDIVFVEEGDARARPLIEALQTLYPFSVSCGLKRRCDTWIFSKKRMIDRGSLKTKGLYLPGAWATLADARGPFTVVALHMTWPLPAGPQQAQSRYVAERLGQFERDSVILGGDFNSTPWSWSLRRQDKMFALQRRTRALASWPAAGGLRLGDLPFPILPIDHVYAGQAWKTVGVRRGPPVGSDHLPVVVTLKRS